MSTLKKNDKDLKVNLLLLGFKLLNPKYLKWAMEKNQVIVSSTYEDNNQYYIFDHMGERSITIEDIYDQYIKNEN